MRSKAFPAPNLEALLWACLGHGLGFFVPWDNNLAMHQ
jgi:hypothetical protein